MISVLISCSDDEYNSAFREFAGIKTTGLPASITEDAGSISIPVLYGGELENELAFDVSYSITGGVYGTDYVVQGGSGSTGTVTVAAGTTGSTASGVIVIQGVADFEIESNVVLTVTLTSADGDIQVGYPYKESYTFTIQDDDCEYVFSDFVGTASSTEVYSTGSYGPYDTEFTEVEENRIVMDNFWDSGMEVELILNGDTRAVEVVERSWSQYGYDWHITGSGTLSTCGKSISIEVHFVSVAYDYDETFTLEYELP